jgi:TM2 domain-containing membrane protein YozV
MDEICPQCGHRFSENHPRFCSACGSRVDGGRAGLCQGGTPGNKNEKNQQVAVFCSSFIPGLGQVYNGETLKGVFFLIGTLLGLFLLLIPGLVVWIYSMYDAHIIAGKMNEGTIEFKPLQPFSMVLFVLAAVVVLIAAIVVFFVIIISSMLSALSPAGSTDFFQMLKISGIYP